MELPIDKFSYFIPLRNVVKWSLTGGGKQKKFQTFSPKSGCSRLQEVPNVMI